MARISSSKTNQYPEAEAVKGRSELSKTRDALSDSREQPRDSQEQLRDSEAEVIRLEGAFAESSASRKATQIQLDDAVEARRLADKLNDKLCSEILERSKIERSLRRSEKRFRDLIENLPVSAYTCDADGLITYFNNRAGELWGRAPKLNHPDDRYSGAFKLFAADGMPIRHDETWMARVLREGTAYEGRELVVERPDGSRSTVLTHAHPLRDESGRLIGAVIVQVDITERKEAVLSRV